MTNDDLREAVLRTTMARYATWAQEHPEGPIHPSESNGLGSIEAYEMILACKALAEYRRRRKEILDP